MNVDYCLFGAKTVADLLEKLVGQEQGVRESRDIEYVHRMRVATRRLREALPLFRECFPQDEFRRWSRAVKRLTRALGGARDLDVQIASVETALEGAPPRDAPGVERLLLRLRQKRAGQQKGLLKALGRFAKSGTEGGMETRVRTLTGRACIAEPPKEPEGNEEIRSRVAESVRERIACVMGFDDLVRNPRNVVQLHEMRKAAKRLRYTLEIFAPRYGGALEDDIKKIKSLQDILGTLHDCDVWLELLPVFVEEEWERMLDWQGHTRGFPRLRTGLENFAAGKREARKAAYAAFAAAWDALCRARWWEDVLKDLAS